ncbi:hypothetical protein JCM19235_308 [Vibrio maritimus]|uniref:Tetratricopeptide repeat protein n=1 Tax=Vibrio maritimus TaxID=990268 RepID=A0A090S2M9_9VIBR|nr:hypothetical protein JCM19235_308 [Vibrio maritimus]
MNIETCWTRFLKAEELVNQGHWPEAYHLFEDVLSHLPSHIHAALTDEQTRPCQFSCMLTGLYDAAVYQSIIFNQLGKQPEAFEVLNQAYATFQFLSIESEELVIATREVLDKHSDSLVEQMGVFCTSQRNANWMLEFEHVQKAHHYFGNLKRYQDHIAASACVN